MAYYADTISTFNFYISTYGPTYIASMLQVGPSIVSASPTLWSIGQSLSSNNSNYLQWVTMDSMGMCLPTSAKFAISDSSVVRCTQYVSSTQQSETNYYLTISKALVGSNYIDLSSYSPAVSGSGTINITNYVS